MPESSTRGLVEFPRLQLLLGWATLLLVLGSALLRGSNWPVTWTLIAMVIFGFFALQVLLDLFSSPTRAAFSLWPAALLYIAVLVWGIVQTLPDAPAPYVHPLWDLVPDGVNSISADPRAGVHIVMRLAAYAMVFFIIMRTAEKSRSAFMMTGFIALYTGLLAAYGIWAALTGENWLLGISDGDGPVQASFPNQNSYATYAIFSAIANLAIYMQLTSENISATQTTKTSLRLYLERFFGGGWIFALGVLLCFAALFLTNSRAGVAAGVLAVLTFLALLAQGGNRKKLLYLLLPFLFLVFALVALTAEVSRRFLLIEADNLRFIIYPRVIEGISDRFLVGHGLEAFQDTFRSYVPITASVGDWNEAHSTILENFYEMGVPAASVFYAALLLISLGILIGGWRRQRNRTLPFMAFACIIGATIHSLADFSLEIPAVAFLFSAILGIGWAQSFRTGYVEPR